MLLWIIKGGIVEEIDCDDDNDNGEFVDDYDECDDNGDDDVDDENMTIMVIDIDYCS